MNESVCRLAASFRDTSGYVFQKNGQLYRRITDSGIADFRHFVDSGLAGELTESGQLVPFTAVPDGAGGQPDLKLAELPFISYPYEWSFSQLREAALLTIDIMLASLQKGMILKDASAFNIAFHRGRAVFLDHTSFTRYEQDLPWCAYRQFIMHFLAPLVLMQKKDLRLSGLLKNDINGVPLDLAVRLLPLRCVLDIDLFFHIYLHSIFEKKYSLDPGEKKKVLMPEKRLRDLLRSLKEYLMKLEFPRRRKTRWGDYTGVCSYTPESLECKKEVVSGFCRRGAFGRICDLGSGSGEFPAIAAAYAPLVIAADMDPGAVEGLFQRSRTLPNIQPVLMDLNNPTPGLGLFNEERSSFLERCRGDAVLGLALIHHLRITGNWTIDRIVRLFRSVAPAALVEFVPLDDPQSRQLLRGRSELCPEWDLDHVAAAFAGAFRKECRIHHLPGSSRVLLELSDR